MKLNDPFGRMERRHQIGYESIRDRLRNSGIDTPAAAREIIRDSKKRALKSAIIGIAVLFLITWLLPKATPVTLSLALLLAVWVVNSTVNGQRYIQRYIEEDLRQGRK